MTNSQIIKKIFLIFFEEQDTVINFKDRFFIAPVKQFPEFYSFIIIFYEIMHHLMFLP